MTKFFKHILLALGLTMVFVPEQKAWSWNKTLCGAALLGVAACIYVYCKWGKSQPKSVDQGDRQSLSPSSSPSSVSPSSQASSVPSDSSVTTTNLLPSTSLSTAIPSTITVPVEPVGDNPVPPCLTLEEIYAGRTFCRHNERRAFNQQLWDLGHSTLTTDELIKQFGVLAQAHNTSQCGAIKAQCNCLNVLLIRKKIDKFLPEHAEEIRATLKDTALFDKVCTK